ncbi:MAG: 15-cis-phytoene synthase [Patescibacteria group bacterium]|jgi:phytoene synthase|nr:15-cis-phytoene synthase [Patescibacteria group bacterium]
MTAQSQLLQEDIALCRAIMKKHGVSYAFATRFFPEQKRDGTAVLYAFFRTPDDIVDVGTDSREDKLRRLTEWRSRWHEHVRGERNDIPVLRAAATVFAQFNIPSDYGDAFLVAMEQDLSVSSYATYADLEGYMYGSAAVVGLMMSHIIGFSDPAALLHAKALGEAMQLTNFLRDIQEDLETRGRVYLPLEDLERFGVTVDDLRSGKITSAFRELMKFEISRARQLYDVAQKGIHYLDADGQFAVRLAGALYAAILDKIEAADYDVFTARRRTGRLEKLWLTLHVWKTQKRGS